LQNQAIIFENHYTNLAPYDFKIQLNQRKPGLLVKELDFYDQEGKSDTIQQSYSCAHPCGLVIHYLHVRPDVHAAISDLGDASAYRTAGYSPSAPPTGVPLTETTPERSNSMKVRLRFEEDELTATLIASKTTQDFISLLPLTLTLEDYGNTEKISYPPRRLSTDAAPAGIDPSVGDITYYAPWGNMAIFIRDFEYSSGLVLLGKIDGDIEALNVSGPVNVMIEMIE
jgi:hypothetical protein